MPVRTITAKYGAHRASIPKFVLAAGARVRTAGLNKSVRNRALALYDEGFTLQEVAARLSANDKTVRNAIMEQGGKIRTRGHRAKGGA